MKSKPGQNWLTEMGISQATFNSIVRLSKAEEYAMKLIEGEENVVTQAFPLPISLLNALNFVEESKQAGFLRYVLTEGVLRASIARQKYARMWSDKLQMQIDPQAIFSPRARKEWPEELQKYKDAINEKWFEMGYEPEFLVRGQKTRQDENSVVGGVHLADINAFLAKHGMEPFHFGGDNGLLEWLENGDWMRNFYTVSPKYGKQGFDLRVPLDVEQMVPDNQVGSVYYKIGDKTLYYKLGGNVMGSYVPPLDIGQYHAVITTAKSYSQAILRRTIQAIKDKQSIVGLDRPEYAWIKQLLNNGMLQNFRENPSTKTAFAELFNIAVRDRRAKFVQVQPTFIAGEDKERSAEDLFLMGKAVVKASLLHLLKTPTGHGVYNQEPTNKKITSTLGYNDDPSMLSPKISGVGFELDLNNPLDIVTKCGIDPSQFPGLEDPNYRRVYLKNLLTNPAHLDKIAETITGNLCNDQELSIWKGGLRLTRNFLPGQEPLDEKGVKQRVILNVDMSQLLGSQPNQGQAGKNFANYGLRRFTSEGQPLQVRFNGEVRTFEPDTLATLDKYVTEGVGATLSLPYYSFSSIQPGRVVPMTYSTFSREFEGKDFVYTSSSDDEEEGEETVKKKTLPAIFKSLQNTPDYEEQFGSDKQYVKYLNGERYNKVTLTDDQILNRNELLAKHPESIDDITERPLDLTSLTNRGEQLVRPKGVFGVRKVGWKRPTGKNTDDSYYGEYERKMDAEALNLLGQQKFSPEYARAALNANKSPQQMQFEELFGDAEEYVKYMNDEPAQIQKYQAINRQHLYSKGIGYEIIEDNPLYFDVDRLKEYMAKGYEWRMLTKQQADAIGASHLGDRIAELVPPNANEKSQYLRQTTDPFSNENLWVVVNSPTEEYKNPMILDPFAKDYPDRALVSVNKFQGQGRVSGSSESAKHMYDEFIELCQQGVYEDSLVAPKEADGRLILKSVEEAARQAKGLGKSQYGSAANLADYINMAEEAVYRLIMYTSWYYGNPFEETKVSQGHSAKYRELISNAVSEILAGADWDDGDEEPIPGYKDPNQVVDADKKVLVDFVLKSIHESVVKPSEGNIPVQKLNLKSDITDKTQLFFEAPNFFAPRIIEVMKHMGYYWRLGRIRAIAVDVHTKDKDGIHKSIEAKNSEGDSFSLADQGKLSRDAAPAVMSGQDRKHREISRDDPAVGPINTRPVGSSLNPALPADRPDKTSPIKGDIRDAEQEEDPFAWLDEIPKPSKPARATKLRNKKAAALPQKSGPVPLGDDDNPWDYFGAGVPKVEPVAKANPVSKSVPTPLGDDDNPWDYFGEAVIVSKTAGAPLPDKDDAWDW